jgi:FlaG/FlaF family flagellin (archaellin)
MERKKAISDIVSTVLIIMIAVAAVGIIGAIVVPMVRDSLQGGTGCLNALNDVSVEVDGTCLSLSNCTDGNCSNISVQVRKGSDATVVLEKLLIQVMDSSGNSEPEEINSTEVAKLTNGGVRTFLIENVNNNAVSITLAPVIKVGNKAVPCDAASGQVTLVSCA